MADAEVPLKDYAGAGAQVKWKGLSDGSYVPATTGDEASYQRINTATTTTVKTGAGILKRVIFNKLVALSVITIYDNTAASGTVIGEITNPATLVASQMTLEYGCAFSTGLTIVTTGIDDITVVYF